MTPAYVPMRTGVVLASLFIAAVELRIFGRKKFIPEDRTDRGSIIGMVIGILLSLTTVLVLLRLQIGNIFPGIGYLGMLVALSGFALRQWSMGLLGMLFTPLVSLHPMHHLITKGPYAVVRHPGYTGLLMEVVGMVLATTNVLAALLALGYMLLALCNRIHIEEAALTNHFGAEYVTYQMKTKKLIPFVY